MTCSATTSCMHVTSPAHVAHVPMRKRYFNQLLGYNARSLSPRADTCYYRGTVPFFVKIIFWMTGLLDPFGTRL